MCASAFSKKQCVTCNKTGGIAICAGCQNVYCGKHFIEHRQELGGKLDNIMQEHDLFQQELGQSSSKINPILKKIDKWEKDSIAKIQAAADTVRKTLQELLEKSKERLSKVCHDIARDLRSSREADDFSENDLARWKEQLKELQLEITSPSSAKLIQDKSTPIYLMTLQTNDTCNKEPPPTRNSWNPSSQEKFLQTLGPVNLKGDDYLAQHVGSAEDYAYVRGRFLYTSGCYTVLFKLEKCKQPYRIFFGCMSSQTDLKEDAFKSIDSLGWFGANQVYENGRCSSNSKKYGYNSSKIKTNDVLYLTLDCDKRQIRLFHEQKKTLCTLSVNHNLVPFPWQFLMVLSKPGDSVKILPNA